jgi:hypothetical protein
MWLDDLFRAAAVVGLDVRVRCYPFGDPLRDVAHVRLVNRVRQVLHPTLRLFTEVPLPIPGDPRSWDAMIVGPDWRQPLEAETALDDTQALERRLALKLRDGGFDRLLVVIADTERNRRVLRAAPHLFVAYPLTGRAVLRALRSGTQPSRSGIVLL